MPTAEQKTLMGFFVRDWRWLNGMSWRRIGWLVAVAAGFALYRVPSDVFLGGDGLETGFADFLGVYFEWFARFLVAFTPMLIALTVADNIRVAGARRVAILIAALLVAAQAASALKCLLPLGFECAGFASGGWRFRMFTEEGLWTVIIGSLLALTFFNRRRDLRVASALHAAELARADVQRRTLESELLAMQARVEPSFLFESLGAIGDLYERDTAAGEQILDDLIRYLRATLPDVRASGTTVGREAALARAYLALLEANSGHRITLEFDSASDVVDLAVPPMLILPLLTGVLGPQENSGALATALRLRVRADTERMHITLAGEGPALRAVEGSAIVRDLCQRLQSLYGDRAALVIDAASDRRLSASIEIPRVST